MSTKAIHTVKGEVNAAIIKGFLENLGIKSAFLTSSAGHSSGASKGPNQNYDILVDEEKAEEAWNILKKEGFIK